MPLRLPAALRGPAPPLLIAFALAATGCELFAYADRDRIKDAGGAGGAGGATSSSGTSGGSCVQPIDCPGMDTDCAVRTCVDGACGTAFVAEDTPTSNQAAGDCKREVCDGKGGTILVDDDLDVPVDDNPCTDDVCTMGVPSNPPSGPGKPCAAPGGKVCDGAAACVACVAQTDCDPGLACVNNQCVTCFDGKKDGDETDVDCGGPTCAPCGDGKACAAAGDCLSGMCAGFPKTCQSAGTGSGGGTTSSGGQGGATSTGSSGGMGGMGGTTSTASSGGTGGAGGTTSTGSTSGSGGSTSGSSSSSSSAGGVVTGNVVGVFLGGAVVPGSGSVQVRGQLVWHAKVSEGSGSIKVNGWLR